MHRDSGNSAAMAVVIINAATTDSAATSGRASWAARVLSVVPTAALVETEVPALVTATLSPLSWRVASAASSSASVAKRCSTSRAFG